MKRHLLTCALLVLLAACTAANSKQYILFYLQKGFIGHPANQFFEAYGNPESEFQSNDGWHVYRWTSLQPVKKLARDPLHVSNYANGEYDTVQLHRSGTARTYCEVNVTTDGEDIIRGFAITVDSMGKWGTSRCSEIFDRTYP